MSRVADKVRVKGVAARDPTAVERASFLDDVRTGMDPSSAARKLTGPSGEPRTSTQFTRLARRDATFSEAYAEALLERQALKADHVDEVIEERALREGAAPAILMGWAARWHPSYRREARQGTAGENDPLELPRPQIDVSLLTDAQVERLDSILREAEHLVAIGQGRAPNPEREALGPGAAE